MAGLLFKSGYFKFTYSLICFCQTPVWFLLLLENFSSCQCYKIIPHFLLTSLCFLTCNSVIHWILECVLRARSYFVFKQVSHSFPQWLEMPRFTPYILIYEALMLTDPSVPLICHSIPVSALHSRFLITIHLNLTNFLQSSSLLIIILFQHFSGHLYMFMLNFRIILSPSVPKRVSLGLWSGLCYTWIW